MARMVAPNPAAAAVATATFLPVARRRSPASSPPLEVPPFRRRLGRGIPWGINVPSPSARTVGLERLERRLPAAFACKVSATRTLDNSSAVGPCGGPPGGPLDKAFCAATVVAPLAANTVLCRNERCSSLSDDVPCRPASVAFATDFPLEELTWRATKEENGSPLPAVVGRAIAAGRSGTGAGPGAGPGTPGGGNGIGTGGGAKCPPALSLAFCLAVSLGDGSTGARSGTSIGICGSAGGGGGGVLPGSSSGGSGSSSSVSSPPYGHGWASSHHIRQSCHQKRSRCFISFCYGFDVCFYGACRRTAIS